MPFAPSISVLTSVYRGEEYLLGFFENLQSQTLFPEIELVLVLNDPSARERTLANDFAARRSSQVRVLIPHKLESLGASWNRAWKAANASNLAIWNVDDTRVPDSLQRQLDALEQDQEAVICYADYIAVDKYGEQRGHRRHTPPYAVNHFRRSFAQGGAFWLLRRSLAERTGTFDEQFRVGPDMEYSFRVAARGQSMIRADGLAGYFTDAAQGLSTRQGALESAVERTAIQLRYGVYDKVHGEYAKVASGYRLDAIRYGQEWIPLSRYLPGHASFLKIRKPLWLFGWLRNALRIILRRIGILPGLYKIQEKYLKRDI
jgi:GT2 family glycosyltransferase